MVIWNEASLLLIVVPRRRLLVGAEDDCFSFAGGVDYARHIRQTEPCHLYNKDALDRLIGMTESIRAWFARVGHEEVRAQSLDLIFVAFHFDD